MTSRSDVADVEETCELRVVDGDRVAAVRERMPRESDVADLADVFGLLSVPGRLRLIVALLDGELCVCDLAAAAGMSESATSHALRILRAHRVVSVRRSGRMAYYSLADAHVRMLLDVALTHIEHSVLVHDHADDGPGERR
ncbi:MAG TPA: metalloregulator ArsR/SmtB family transcription factor [Marmoricola sp.]|nr:metalloregulator ArsR/SmtB family transcription factor [Marmoricola sp.]